MAQSIWADDNLTQWDKDVGFRSTGFCCITRKVEISVWIIRRQRPLNTSSYDVYLFHGVPGGPFWLNLPPLVSCETDTQAFEVAERLFGVSGSKKFANLVNFG